MVSYLTTIEQASFDGMPAWRLIAPEGQSALITERGATLISWEPTPGTSVVDGYTNASELMSHDGNRSLVMAPWCGRMVDSSYRFNGVTITRTVDAQAISARCAEADFTRIPAGDALQLHASLSATAGYPWEVDVTVVFSLEGGAAGFEHLSVTIEVVNASTEAAPVSIGWQPFLRLPGMDGISNLSLRVPARAKVLTDARKIPLHGDAAFAGISAPAVVDYLGQQSFDDSYTELVPTEDGVVVTSLTNPAKGEQMLVTQEPAEAPVVHVYTGDSLSRGPRYSIAVSPCSAVSNAFNRADEASRLGLEPGGSCALTATLSYRSSK